jgi:hypothetical protein
MTWEKPEVKTYDEAELAAKLAVRAATHSDGHDHNDNEP